MAAVTQEKEQQGMGRVLTEATVENLQDLYAVKLGVLTEDRVRRITVADALVDTGSTRLSLPRRLIQQLGLEQTGTKPGTSTVGITDFNAYGAVRLTIQGRDCSVDVVEVPDVVPVLIGQVPLELLDFVVDMKTQKLVGNPAHGGEQMLEMY